MFVSDILTQKGARVFTIAPEASLAGAVDMLVTRRIGSVLVMDTNGNIAGIISERDVVRAISSQGAAAMSLRVAEAMTAEVVVCDPDDSIDQVMEVMTSGRFRHLPVVRHGELYGLVSIGDVVKARLEDARHEAEALKAYIVAS
jgi:CBS domain-containing protein